VPEERPRGDAGALGDLGHGGLLVALVDEELQGRLAQSSGSVRLPSGHPAILGDVTS
jgi:hypothetical protein